MAKIVGADQRSASWFHILNNFEADLFQIFKSWIIVFIFACQIF
jgi:hypothetical protein